MQFAELLKQLLGDLPHVLRLDSQPIIDQLVEILSALVCEAIRHIDVVRRMVRVIERLDPLLIQTHQLVQSAIQLVSLLIFADSQALEDNFVAGSVGLAQIRLVESRKTVEN